MQAYPLRSDLLSLVAVVTGKLCSSASLVISKSMKVNQIVISGRNRWGSLYITGAFYFK